MATKVLFVYVVVALISALQPATLQVAAQPTAGEQVPGAEHSTADGPRNINNVTVSGGPAGPTDAAHLGTTMATNLTASNLTATESAPTTVSGHPPPASPATAPVEHHPAPVESPNSAGNTSSTVLAPNPPANLTTAAASPTINSSSTTGNETMRPGSAAHLATNATAGHPGANSTSTSNSTVVPPANGTAANPANPAATIPRADNTSVAAGHPPAMNVTDTFNASTTAAGHPRADNTSVIVGHPPAMNATETLNASTTAAGHPRADNTSVIVGHPPAMNATETLNASTTAAGHPRADNTSVAVGHPPAMNATETFNGSTTAAGHPRADNTSVAAGHPPAMNITTAAPNATAHPPVNPDLSRSSNASSAPSHALEQAHSPQEPPPESPPTTTCFPRTLKHLRNIRTHHCHIALDQIVYAPNRTIDYFSRRVFVNYKSCNIDIHKTRNSSLHKDQLDLIVHDLTTACPSKGGLWASSKMTVEVKRGQEEVYEVDRPTCKKEKCAQTVGDCLSAFYQLPTDRITGLLVAPGKTGMVHVSAGNCTVTVSTTDLSAFTVTRQQVLPAMKKLVTKCREHPGTILFAGGTKGFNGDVRLSVTPANHDLCS